MSEQTELLDTIEQGYRGILEVLGQCEISGLPPEVRVAAYISRAALQYDLLKEQIEQAAGARPEVILPQGPLIPTEDMMKVHPDAVIGALVEATAITLGMEARTNGWLDKRRYVVLPPLPSVGDDERFKAGWTEVLAMYWRRWRRVEERRRFLGGTLKDYVPPDLPSGMPPETRRLTIYRLRAEEALDYIANERLTDWLGQTFLGQTFVEILTQTNADAKARVIEASAPLLPGAFVTAQEVHAAESLTELLGYEILQDTERPGGMRLVEWVRGYAVLQALAESRQKTLSGPDRLTFIIERKDLLATLHRCGLEDPSAERLVDAASLKDGSRDMFDCPLIRMAGDSLMVFAPGLLTANLPAVVLSVIGASGEALSRKGRAFEAAMLKFFREQGLRAESFTAWRDQAEYQYDLVVVWGDYVFVVECKNQSLSNRHPVRAYYFELQMASYGEQVKRLAEALKSHPAILRERMGIDTEGKTIVPCVLNSLPYSRPGADDGVYFTDSSSLKRFFRERHLHLSTSHPIEEHVKILHRTAMYAQWAGDAPAPEDLMRQLEDPFQIRLMLAHTEIAARPFSIAPGHFVAAQEFVRTEMTIESYAELVGKSAEAIRIESTEVARNVDVLRARLRKERGEAT